MASISSKYGLGWEISNYYNKFTDSKVFPIGFSITMEPGRYTSALQLYAKNMRKKKIIILFQIIACLNSEHMHFL